MPRLAGRCPGPSCLRINNESPVPLKTEPTVIAIDGTSASGKSTNARLVAKALGYTYVDTGAMYRTLAWYCLQKGVDVHDAHAVVEAGVRWKKKTSLECVGGAVRLLVDGYYPAKEIRTVETSAAVPHVAAISKVRLWMKKMQQDCLRFGDLVMEGRDIGSNVFPDSELKFYLDASLDERSKRREAEGVSENLAARDHRDSQRKDAPLIIPLGAKVINTSQMTPEQSSAIILDETKRRLAARAADRHLK
jgi:cytidylate kinase